MIGIGTKLSYAWYVRFILTNMIEMLIDPKFDWYLLFINIEIKMKRNLLNTNPRVNDQFLNFCTRKIRFLKFLNRYF